MVLEHGICLLDIEYVVLEHGICLLDIEYDDMI